MRLVDEVPSTQELLTIANELEAEALSLWEVHGYKVIRLTDMLMDRAQGIRAYFGPESFTYSIDNGQTEAVV